MRWIIKKKLVMLGLGLYRLVKRFKSYLRAQKKLHIRNNSSRIFYLNIGAGASFLKKNWRVLEYSGSKYKHNARLIDFNINLFDNLKFPISNNSVDLIYSSHTFEHLHDNNVIHILNESYRILKAGGGVRVSMPNIDPAYDAFLNNDIDFFIKNTCNVPTHTTLLDKFSRYFSSVDKSEYPNIEKDFKALSKNVFLDKYTNDIDYRTLNRDFGDHMNWFNQEKLFRLFAQSGFKNIKLSKCKESEFDEMRGKEFDNTYQGNSIYVEAIK